MAKLGEAHTNKADQWFEVRTTGEDDPQRAAFVDKTLKKYKSPFAPVDRSHPNTDSERAHEGRGGDAAPTRTAISHV
jgi:hypothetical protein